MRVACYSCAVWLIASATLFAQDIGQLHPWNSQQPALMKPANWGSTNWQPPLPGMPADSFEEVGVPFDDSTEGPAFAPPLRSHKDGFFQRLSLTGTWLDAGNAFDVGVTEVELYLATALPFPSRDQPLVITPGFDMRTFEGPIQPDLPETVYDSYLQFMWVPRWNEQWSAYLSVAPGVYSDFEQFNEDAIRVVGKGIARYEMLPGTLELLLGVMYLNRGDYNVLPAGGVVWTPWEDVRYELLFPRPRAAMRFAAEPGYWEDWCYISGEFGGDTWLVERAGIVERMTMRDLRALAGVERKKDGGAGYRIEFGYVFARSFEFDVSATEYEPDDTALVRFGASY